MGSPFDVFPTHWWFLCSYPVFFIWSVNVLWIMVGFSPQSYLTLLCQFKWMFMWGTVITLILFWYTVFIIFSTHDYGELWEEQKTASVQLCVELPFPDRILAGQHYNSWASTFKYWCQQKLRKYLHNQIHTHFLFILSLGLNGHHKCLHYIMRGWRKFMPQFVLLYPLNCYSVILFHRHSVALFSPALPWSLCISDLWCHDRPTVCRAVSSQWTDVFSMCGSVWRLSRRTDDG